MSVLNIKQLRSETLGTEHVNHLNNAGASLIPDPVHHKVLEYLEKERSLGGYEVADQCHMELENCYSYVGGIVGSEPHNIAFTENATASFSLALSSITLSSNDVILTSTNDYASNQIMYLSLVERFGVRLVRIEDDPEGTVDLNHLEKLLHRLRPKLVAISHIPTSSGMVQPIKAVGNLCRQYDSLYLVDACQSVGQMPIDVKEIQCDFLSASGRKFLRGPRGTGFLFIADRILDMGFKPLFPDLRGADWISENRYQPVPDARRFENWEFPYSLILGLGYAAKYAFELGIENIHERSWNLANKTRDLLSDCPRISLLDLGIQKSAIVTVALEGKDAAEISGSLRKMAINTSVCTKYSAIIDFDKRNIDSALRISPHYFNTDEEIEELASVLSGLLGQS
ncbi:MAG: aminotransferase [Gemmatimonadetes bacterium]|nr:aminotransferase [Gemmatimonadota bacterium]